MAHRLGLAVLLLSGCSSDIAEAPRVLSLTLEPTEVAPGAEIESTCRSWTLGNDEPLFINAVTARTDPGFHHSNWYFVPEDLFAGPDGTWACEDREFDDLAAGLEGGVLFAQSTQSSFDEQRFAPGAAIRVPERVRIVAQSHLLNFGESTIAAGMKVDLELLHAGDVERELQLMGFAYSALEIPPQTRSRFVMDCAVGDVFSSEFDRPADFNLYYSLAHYHGMGTLARAELVGGQHDGEMLFETAGIGDPLGHNYAPPVNVGGMSAMRITCEYDNPTERTITWGLGDGEMCAVGFYTDAPYRLAGFALGHLRTEVEDGVTVFHGDCRVLGDNP